MNLRKPLYLEQITLIKYRQESVNDSENKMIIQPKDKSAQHEHVELLQKFNPFSNQGRVILKPATFSIYLKSNYPKVGERYKTQRTMAHHQWVWAFNSLFGKTIWHYLIKSQKCVLHQLAIPFFHTPQSKILVCEHQETWSRMPLPPKAQKQPGYQSKGSQQIG